MPDAAALPDASPQFTLERSRSEADGWTEAIDPSKTTEQHTGRVDPLRRLSLQRRPTRPRPPKALMCGSMDIQRERRERHPETLHHFPMDYFISIRPTKAAFHGPTSTSMGVLVRINTGPWSWVSRSRHACSQSRFSGFWRTEMGYLSR